MSHIYICHKSTQNHIHSTGGRRKSNQNHIHTDGAVSWLVYAHHVVCGGIWGDTRGWGGPGDAGAYNIQSNQKYNSPTWPPSLFFLSTHLCIDSSLALQETSVPGSWEHRPALWWRLGTMEITSPCPVSKQRQQKMCAEVQWTRQKWLGMRWNEHDHMYGCGHWSTKFAKLFRIVEAYHVVLTYPD